ncbi:MAG: hypothetical protein BAJATHORv1_40092 [Candidatus Thorarchaeota archaeon]|nr:MAG: hypothetical protein BAJATHORv1_40092 [Candidatus Thorarchaeota archaeon]
MTGTSTTEVKCVKCKRIYESVVIDHIDLSEDRELVRKIKSGKANRVQCPKCKKVMYLDRSIVINFEPQNLIVLYDPNLKKKEDIENVMRSYESIIGFNEIFEEIGAETEFKVISDIKKLKTLITDYAKLYM